MTTATAAPKKAAKRGSSLKMEVSRLALLSTVKRASMACTSGAKESIKPILACLLIQADEDEGKVFATGTDLDKLCRSSCEATIDTGGEFAVNARDFSLALDRMTDSSIAVQVEDDTVHLIGDRAKLTFNTLKAGDFPTVDLPSGEPSCRVMAGVLGDLFRLTKDCTSQSNTGSARFAYDSINFRVANGEIELSALDGKTFAIATAPAPFQGAKTENDTLVPPVALRVAIETTRDEADTDLDVWIKPESITIRSKRTAVYSRLLTGKFPDLRDLQRKYHKTKATATVKAGDFLRAIRQAEVVCPQDERRVQITMNDEGIFIEPGLKTRGDGTVELEAEVEGSDEVVFMSANLTESLSALNPDDEIVIQSGGDTPFIISRGKNWLFGGQPLSKTGGAK